MLEIHSTVAGYIICIVLSSAIHTAALALPRPQIGVLGIGTAVGTTVGAGGKQASSASSNSRLNLTSFSRHGC